MSNNTKRRVALAAVLALVIPATAFAQVVGGGGGGAGLFAGLYSWFSTNIAPGIGILTAVGLGFALLAARAHHGYVAGAIIGLLIIGNAMAISGLFTYGG